VAQSRNRRSRAYLVLLVLVAGVSLFAYVARHRDTKPVADAAKGTPPATSVSTPTTLAAPSQAPENVTLAQGAADTPVRTETPTPGSKTPAPTGPAAPPRQTAASPVKPAKPDPATATQAAAKESGRSATSTTAPAASRPAAPIDPAAPLALADAKRQIEAGDFLAARASLNAALPSLSGIELDAAKTMLADVNKTVVFSNKRFADDPFGGTYKVQSGDVLQKIAASHGLSWELLCRINGMSDPKRLRAGATIKVLQGPFHAVVSKSTFRIDLYLGGPGGPGSMFVTSLPVGLGKSNSTPTGTWKVNDTKQKNPKFWGFDDLPPMESDAPKNPLGEFWLGLDGISGQAVGAEGYGIHGTIEPDSIGKNASHGCIRLRNGDLDLIWEALVPSKSTVVIVD
jgi:LysM repeat protein